MEVVYLSLGSNLGERFGTISSAFKELSTVLTNVNASSLYQTEPVDMPKETPWFLNSVVHGETDLTPNQLLEKVSEIEKKLGRERDVSGASADSTMPNSRAIDIDILFYGSKIINEPNLVIPHPRMAERKFVLLPMCELSRNFVHPVLKKTMWALLAECKDSSAIL